MNMQELIEAWYKDNPRQASVFIAIISNRYKSKDAEEVLSRFKADKADQYLRLKTGLEGRYAATQADLERQAGKLALAKTKPSATVQVSIDTDALTEAQNRVKDLEGVFQNQQFEGFKSAISTVLRQGGVDSVAYSNDALITRIANEMSTSGLFGQTRKALDIYNLASDLDSNKLPSVTAIQLATEAVKQRRN